MCNENCLDKLYIIQFQVAAIAFRRRNTDKQFEFTLWFDVVFKTHIGTWNLYRAFETYEYITWQNSGLEFSCPCLLYITRQHARPYRHQHDEVWTLRSAQSSGCAAGIFWCLTAFSTGGKLAWRVHTCMYLEISTPTALTHSVQQVQCGWENAKRVPEIWLNSKGKSKFYVLEHENSNYEINLNMKVSRNSHTDP